MENINKWIDARIKIQNFENITTDAVHRRFVNKKEPETEEYFYCKQCDVKIIASPLKEELKSHYENKRHKSYDNCVYCLKPVYSYHYKGDVVFHHSCPPS